MICIFAQVQNFLYRSSKEGMNSPRFPEATASVLLAAITGCVLIYSRLEETITNALGTPVPDDVQNLPASLGRIRWALWQSDIEKLFLELQKHKCSLQLILSIITW